jgi:hypothetical protein
VGTTNRGSSSTGSSSRDSSSTSSQGGGDFRSYVYEEPGVYDDMGQDAHIRLSDATGKEIKDTSTLAAVGQGASVGATVGTAVPIPGVGSAVGTIVGSVAGLASGLFGGGEPETKMRNVLPIMLKAIFEQKGASGTFAYPNPGKRGKGGLKLTGKAFEPDMMLDAVKEVQRQLGGSDTHSRGDAERYNSRLKVSNSPPSGRERIIVSFPRPRPTPEVTANSTPAKNGTSSIVYLLGAGIPLAYFLTR